MQPIRIRQLARERSECSWRQLRAASHQSGAARPPVFGSQYRHRNLGRIRVRRDTVLVQIFRSLFDLDVHAEVRAVRHRCLRDQDARRGGRADERERTRELRAPVEVEPPGGEPFRSIDDLYGAGESAYYYAVNRSKRSMVTWTRSGAFSEVRMMKFSLLLSW